MITKNGNSIRVSDTRHKFDSALCEYVYDDMESWADFNNSGDAECPVGWYAKVGDKRIISGDERGFVYLRRFGNEAERDVMYNALDHVYYAWSNEDMSEPRQQLELELATAYLAYVVECEDDATWPYEYDAWLHRQNWDAIHIIGQAMVCEDCYMAHHGYISEYEGKWYREGDGYDDGHTDHFPLSLLNDVELSDNTNSETGEGIETFSWSWCQGCGSTLGGSRHRLQWMAYNPPAGWSYAQARTAVRLCHDYHVPFVPSSFIVHADDAFMMAGYAEGWIGSVYFGIDRDGRASS
jgi:hypothetical protein